MAICLQDKAQSRIAYHYSSCKRNSFVSSRSAIPRFLVAKEKWHAERDFVWSMDWGELSSLKLCDINCCAANVSRTILPSCNLLFRFLDGWQGEASLQNGLICCQMRQPQEEVAKRNCPKSVTHQRIWIHAEEKKSQFIDHINKTCMQNNLTWTARSYCCRMPFGWRR